MREIIKEYCRYLELAGKSGRTVSSYRQDLLNLAGWAQEMLGEAKLTTLTPLDLQEYRRQLIEHCKPATVNKAMVVIKAFCRWAEANGQLSQSPALALKSVRAARPAPRWLEKKEQLRLVREVQRAGNKRNIALIALMLHTGLRCAEVCSLKMGDLDLAERKGKVTVRCGEGERWREVPLNSDARKALAAYLQCLPEQKSPGEWLFATKRSKKMSTRALQHLVARHGKKAGMPQLSPHLLRHTFCHELVSRGNIPLDVVAALAGHMTADGRPNLKTTLIYTTPSREELQRAVEKLSWD